MRAKATFTIEVSSTIMKKAAPVATTGIQSAKMSSAPSWSPGNCDRGTH